MPRLAARFGARTEIRVSPSQWCASAAEPPPSVCPDSSTATWRLLSGAKWCAGPLDAERPLGAIVVPVCRQIPGSGTDGSRAITHTARASASPTQRIRKIAR